MNQSLTWLVEDHFNFSLANEQTTLLWLYAWQQALLSKAKFDANDQMTRYCRWVETGYRSSNGRCFDVGVTVGGALNQFRLCGNPFSGSANPRTAGNGCIMRLAPIPMFYYPDRIEAIKMSGESSRTTHGADECIECSQLFGAILYQALDGTLHFDDMYNKS